MAQPQVNHPGLLVPNGVDVASTPRMAEVDAVDFNSLANSRYGVIDGCFVSVTGSTALVTAGWAVINGTLYQIQAGSLPLGVGGSQDRFDIVVATKEGVAKVRRGVESSDPVFPDPAQGSPSSGDGETLLAAIYCPASASAFSDYVVDKRKMLPRSLATVTDANFPYILRSLDGTGGVDFEIQSDGEMHWEGDTTLRRSAPGELNVNNFDIDTDLTVGGDTSVVGDVSAGGAITGENFVQGATLPAVGPIPMGAIHSNTVTGALHIRLPGGWTELATVDNAIPTGSLIHNVNPPSYMSPLGWKLLDGQTWSESDPALSGLFALTALVPFMSGVAPNRTMTLPSAVDKVLMGASQAGHNLTTVGANNKVIPMASMPRHDHDGSLSPDGAHTPEGTIGRNGRHGHLQKDNSGQHGHPVNDPGHRHNGFEGIAGTPTSAVVLWWGGNNKIDALFNDSNHTFSVEAARWISEATTGITIGTSGSGHTHVLEPAPDHSHGLVMEGVPNHDHDFQLEDAGNNSPFDVRQASLRTYAYIQL